MNSSIELIVNSAIEFVEIIYCDIVRADVYAKDSTRFGVFELQVFQSMDILKIIWIVFHYYNELHIARSTQARTGLFYGFAALESTGASTKPKEFLGSYSSPFKNSFFGISNFTQKHRNDFLYQ